MTRDFIERCVVVERTCGKRHKTHLATCYTKRPARITDYEQRDDGLWRDKR